MDDIRQPQNQRRDFAMRHRTHQPANQPPEPQPPVEHHHQHPQAPQPAHQPPAAPAYYDSEPQLPAEEPAYEHYSAPNAESRPHQAAKKRRLPLISVKYLAAGLVLLILLGTAGYILSRPAKKTGFSVNDLAKKSTFGFYYPQPLPQGYTYVEQINAFQNGQAYFMLGNGAKHIVFHEEAASGELDNKSITNAHSVNTPVGKAVIGTTAGQPAARVLAGSTLVSVNTTGSVPAADLVRAINQLKASR
jgi:hypothetical protein